MDENTLIIWDKMEDKLLSFISQQVRDIETAKDIKQDVFLKVFTKLDTLKDKDKMIPWIYQITRNEVNTHFRKMKYKTPINDIGESEILEENLTSELSKCMRQMIGLLPEKYKQALNLTEIEGISQKDLAQNLNISYSGAKSRVQRGREMLKSILQECCVISTDKYGNIIEYRENNCKTNCD